MITSHEPHTSIVRTPSTRGKSVLKESDLLHFVDSAWRAGFNLIPAKGKRPLLREWKPWQTTRQTADDLRGMFTHSTQGVALVTGFADLEVTEFDDADVFTLFRDTASGMEGYEFIADMLEGWSDVSPGGGTRLIYLCSEVGGNQKLAERPHATDPNKRNALIETRGKGGYTLCAPSHGNAHPTGRPYTLVSGGPDTIVRITPEQRKQLHDLARMFDEMPVREAYVPPSEPRSIADGKRPGDAYDASFTRDTWRQQLTSDGWTFAHSHGQIDYYVRPDKKVSDGISASVNHGGKCRLYVFTSSTSLEQETMYSPFAYYAYWHHGGSFSAAGKALYSEGYGERWQGDKPTLTIAPERTEQPTAGDTDDFRMKALIAENDAMRAQIKALEKLILNPDLKDAPKKLGYQAIVLAHKYRADADPDGYVALSAAQISDDWRPKPEKGTPAPEVNPHNGRKPLASRQTVKGTLQKLDCLDMKLMPVVRTHKSGDRYNDTEILIRVTDPVEAIVDLAEYRSEKSRKQYTRQEPCPHCGEIHALTVRKFCGTPDDPGCNQQVGPDRVVPVPPASRPIDDLDDAQVARLDDAVTAPELASTKNVEASSDGVTSSNNHILTTTFTKKVEAEDTGKIGRYCSYRIGGETCGEITEDWETGYGSQTLCHRHASEYRDRRSTAPPRVVTEARVYRSEVAS